MSVIAGLQNRLDELYAEIDKLGAENEQLRSLLKWAAENAAESEAGRDDVWYANLDRIRALASATSTAGEDREAG